MKTNVSRIFNFLLLFLSTLTLLSGCNSSSGSPRTAVSSKSPHVNQNLVYEHSLGKATIQPHHTAILDQPYIADGDGTGFHELSYEILDIGRYKFCIPEDDSHIDRIELYDLNNTEQGVWKKGDACTSMRLQPGRYTMHVHHTTTDDGPMVFFKPHTVTQVVTTGTKISARTVQFTDNIPDNQFVDQMKTDFNAIVTYNNTNLKGEKWGLWGFNDSTYITNLHQISLSGYPKIVPAPSLNDPYVPKVSAASQIGTNDLFAVTLSDTPGLVNILQGNSYLVSVPVTRNLINYTVNNSVARQAASGNSSAKLYFKLNSNTGLNSFTLATSDSSSLPFVGFETYDVNGDWGGGPMIMLSSINTANPNPLPFTVTVRYGTTTGTILPALLSNEVALFDSCYGANGFDGTATYWIINKNSNSNYNFKTLGAINNGLPNFNDFAFDNPGGRIKTIMAGRGVQAQAYAVNNYQGDNFSVVSPLDKDMIVSCSDIQQLNVGNINSVAVSARSGGLKDYEYEHHVIVSAKTCVGCDLRGFKFTPGASFPKLSNVNFSNSDLSYSDFSNPDFAGSVTVITAGKFSNTLFNNANLSNIWFYNALLDGADLSGAILDKTTFSIVGSPNPNAYFYNACPIFDNVDLSGLEGNFDSLFPISSDGKSFFSGGTTALLVDGWWSQNGCKVSMKNAKLPTTLFSNPRLWQFIDPTNVDFRMRNLDNAVFTKSNLGMANFSGASLKNSSFASAKLGSAKFNSADLTNASLHGISVLNMNTATKLTGANFSGANLNKASLAGMNLSNTIWNSGAYTNWDGLKINYLATTLSNAYLYNTSFYNANLSNVNMQTVTWYGPNATGENAILANTKFNSANLPGLSLQSSSLQGADFTGAMLMNANLRTKSGFGNTIFTNANLIGANLANTNLAGASLAGAVVSTTSNSDGVWVKVGADPTIYQNSFEFILQDFNATTPPASTVEAMNCPDGNTPDQTTGCGDITGARWVIGPVTTIIPTCIFYKDLTDPDGDTYHNVYSCM